MGLFSKKPPCPICQGKISWLLPSKIEGEYVCSTCYGKIDMQEDAKKNLTMEEFKEYLVFYDQNQQLKEQFTVTEKIDFGFLGNKCVFDFEHNLFCMSKNLDKTIFKGSELTFFTIKEDSLPLFKGSTDGLDSYPSSIPDQARAMAPQIYRFMRSKQRNEALKQSDDKDYRQESFDFPEPFTNFVLELHFDHPYWEILEWEIKGPEFSDENPNVDSYLNDYERSIEEINNLAKALMTVAFPQERMQTTSFDSASRPSANIASSSSNAIDEIRKFKELLDEGILSKEEFEVKKKQLLGL